MKRLLLFLVLLATAASAQEVGTTLPNGPITSDGTTTTIGGSGSQPTTVNGLLTVNGGETISLLAAPASPAVVQLDATTGHLLHNQAYFYKIVPTNTTSGNGAGRGGAISIEATFTTAASPVPDTYSATVSWTAVPGATGYDIYRSTTTGTELFLASVSGGSTISYTDNSATTPTGALPVTNNSSLIRTDGNRVALAADWTCGTGGIVSSCASAAIIGSAAAQPLTFVLPKVAASYKWECDLVVGQATADTANSWNFITAGNGATNVTAAYDMHTAATALTGGATTDQGAITTTIVIGPTWTLGGLATKMPVHIWGQIEGASASGTTLSLQLVAPTVGDLVTIYRGSNCTIR